MWREPTPEARVERIRKVARDELRHLASAHRRTTDEAERHSIQSYMYQVAVFLALAEGPRLDDRSMLTHRTEIVAAFQRDAGGDPAPPPRGGPEQDPG